MLAAWLHETARFAAGVACCGLLVAGRLDARGAGARARRLARRAGMAQAALTALQLGFTPGLPWSTGDAWLLSLSQMLGATAGIVALLGGLAGKPRPSGGFAAAAWCAALLLRLAA